MLKTIGMIMGFFLAASAYAHEYEVQILDNSTGEIQTENCADKNELNLVTNFLSNHSDGSIEFTVRKINSFTTDAIKRGGVEGGGD
ncbi:MAG: hypothetical protein EHM20_07760 [Alphaproteobacteria bacterium]|nr:MAG: hypothetical protein EHM20_07760 [Alphaproteobacteria bacterium]